MKQAVFFLVPYALVMTVGFWTVRARAIDEQRYEQEEKDRAEVYYQTAKACADRLEECSDAFGICIDVNSELKRRLDVCYGRK